MQFIYLGEVRFYEERMSEFLLVSKNLEIQDLVMCIEMNDHDQSTSNDQSIEHDNDNGEDLLVNKDATFPKYEDVAKVEPQARTRQEIPNKSTKLKHETHIQSKHEGIKYACNHCDYQATTQRSLTRHMKSKHL